MTNIDLGLSLFFLAVIGGICILNKKLGFDVSRGETHPTWKDKAQYLKAYVHLVSAFAATALMEMVGVPWWAASVLMLVGMVGWEWSQNFFNKLDIVSGSVGVAAAVGMWTAGGWMHW